MFLFCKTTQSIVPPDTHQRTLSATFPYDSKLEGWLTLVGLGVLIEKLRKSGVTWELLAVCTRPEDLLDYGLTWEEASVLLRKIEEGMMRGDHVMDSPNSGTIP